MAAQTPRCISFDSYIKPQLPAYMPFTENVVYLLIPTSNHNSLLKKSDEYSVVYLLIPTSNHNLLYLVVFLRGVVYLLIPTSNHNTAADLTATAVVVYLLIPTSNHNNCYGMHKSCSLYIF